MTVDTATPLATYSVAGTGPYPIDWPYTAGSINVLVPAGDQMQALASSAWSVTPEESAGKGNLYLTPAAAAACAGLAMTIVRETADEQGWKGVLGEREAGLEAQLDQLTMAVQDLRRALAGAIRLVGAIAPVVIPAGSTLIRTEDGFGAGPTTEEISGAEASATAAAAHRAAAEAAAAAALAAENSLLYDAGAWAAGVAYRPSAIVTYAGASYICNPGHGHTANTFAADLAAGHWREFAAKGAAGTGTGDMLAANALSEIAEAKRDLALAHLGLGTFGIALAKATDIIAAWNALLLGDMASFDRATEAEARAGLLNSVGMTPLTTAQAMATLPFTRAYQSSEQTITSGGLLTLAHGLGAVPKLITGRVKCLTAEAGYAVGDQVAVALPIGSSETGTRLNSVMADATNISIRLTSYATVFAVGHKTTGAAAFLTNSRWALIVEAFA